MIGKWADPEYRREYFKNYRATHKEQISDKKKSYYLEHQDAIKARVNKRHHGPKHKQILEKAHEYTRRVTIHHSFYRGVIICPKCDKKGTLMEEFKRNTNTGTMTFAAWSVRHWKRIDGIQRYDYQCQVTHLIIMITAYPIRHGKPGYSGRLSEFRPLSRHSY